MIKITYEIEMTEEGLAATVEAAGAVIAEKGARVAFLKSEAARLKAMADREQKIIDTLKQNISNAMTSQGTRKIETDHFKFSFRSSVSVEIFDFDLLPDRFKRVTTKTEADKTRIKNHLKAGGKLVGASLATKENIQIK